MSTSSIGSETLPDFTLCHISKHPQFKLLSSNYSYLGKSDFLQKFQFSYKLGESLNQPEQRSLLSIVSPRVKGSEQNLAMVEYGSGKNQDTRKMSLVSSASCRPRNSVLSKCAALFGFESCLCPVSQNVCQGHERVWCTIKRNYLIIFGTFCDIVVQDYLTKCKNN